MSSSKTRATDAERSATADEAELYGELYRRMLVIREFEETVQSLFQKGHVHGTTHLYSGQEAGAAQEAHPCFLGRQAHVHQRRPARPDYPQRGGEVH